MAARLYFARAPEIGRFHLRALERVPAGHDRVLGENRAELERERVERILELVRREQQRRRESGVVPFDPRAGRRRADRRPSASRRSPSCESMRCVRVAAAVCAGRPRGAPYVTSDCRRPPKISRRSRSSARTESGSVMPNIVRDTCRIRVMRLRRLNVGCFGGGTGLPSLLGGLKIESLARRQRGRHDVRQRRQLRPAARRARRPAARRHPEVRARAVAQRARSASRAAGAPADARGARLGGHTGGNLLLSMMQRYSGDFLDAIDGLRALLGCRGRVWPVSVQQATVCAEYGDGSVDARRSRSGCGADVRPVRPTHLARAAGVDPPGGRDRDRRVRRRDHRAGQLLHQPHADFSRARRRRRARHRCAGR